MCLLTNQLCQLGKNFQASHKRLRQPHALTAQTDPGCVDAIIPIRMTDQRQPAFPHIMKGEIKIPP